MPFISEVMVHVLLEYLLIRSHEVLYVFNIMMQSLERVLSGNAANELMRRQTNLCNNLTSNSSDDIVCEEHRIIEVN